MKDVKGFSSIDSTYNDGNNIYRLTDKGIQNIETYIAELHEKFIIIHLTIFVFWLVFLRAKKTRKLS